MVFTELVQNAVEHAFDENRGGTIAIRCERAGRAATVVEDDGLGLPADSTWRTGPASGSRS